MNELDPSTVREHPQTAVLIDAHAHCHGSFEIDEFLDHALRNFTSAAEKLAPPARIVGLLALTEGREESAFDRFLGASRDFRNSAWQLERTSEAISLIAKRGGAIPLFLIAGQQIRLRNGLELLAVGGNPGMPDGRSLDATMAAIRNAGALPVLPWGFGKWWLRRGRIVERLLDETPPDQLLLADSGTRAALSPNPRLFARARRLGFRILAGSDPLPLRGEVGRPGSYGCLVEGSFSAKRPAASLQDLLATADRVQIFGTLRPLANFLRAQLAMQIRKRRG